MRLISAGLIYILFAIILLVAGCQTNPSNESLAEISVNPDEAQKAQISDIFGYKAVNIDMPDSLFFGNIEDIKTDDERVYLFDPSQTKTITILNKKGNFINQLKNIGNGPGEYRSPFAFAIDNFNDELILYDRAKLAFLTYKVPSLKFLGSKRINALLMNFEILDSDHILVVRDDSKNRDKLYGLEIWNREYEVVKDQISDMRNAVIELSYPSTIGQSKSGFLYAHPFTGVISQINPSGLSPIFDLKFGKWEIPDELYSMNEALPFEQALAQQDYVLWPRLPLHSDNRLMVWYMFGADVNNYHLLTFNIPTGAQHAYSEIMLEESSLKIPMPLGLDKDQYISLIWPKHVNREELPDQHRDIFEKSLKTKLPIILYLK